MTAGTLIEFGLGLLMLIIGAEALVRGASRLAARFGVSSLVIGLTVVAYGTGAPELAVSVTALAQGQADLSVGNAIGSNLANILLVLGAVSLIAPLVVSRQLIRFDLPVMIGATVLVFAFAFNNRIGLVEGAALLLGGIVYTVVLVRKSPRNENESVEPGIVKPRGGVFLNIVLIALGLAVLVRGSQDLTSAASVMAKAFGMSDLVIGLTVVAGGTSLPELATSVTAVLRGERDLAVGNVIGSCIFNLLTVVGVAGILSPSGLAVSPAVHTFDLPVLIVASLACVPIFVTGKRVARLEGAVFFAYYIAYVLYLVMHATDHDSLTMFSAALVWFALPITAVVQVIALARELKKRRTG